MLLSRLMSDVRIPLPWPRAAKTVLSLRKRAELAMDWLIFAQDATPDGGVSAGYHLKDGWLPSYPETTGYIACTFFDRARHEPPLKIRAWRMIDWLLEQQLDCGAFRGQFGERSGGPIVFNTGQILLGLVRAMEEEPSRVDVACAAERAAGWLVKIMDDDGCWRRYTHNGVPHSYNARTAWALLRFAEIAADARAHESARRNLAWTLRQQTPDGYLEHLAFGHREAAYLHTIAYALRGLLESALILSDEVMFEAAARSSRRLAELLLRDGRLAVAYEDGFRPAGRYRCLTGEAQMGIVWARLFERTRESCFADACEQGVRFVGSTQFRAGPGAIRGAIAGSSPIWGRYSRFEFPNWAAKFFVDAVDALQSIRPEAVEGAT